MINYLVQIVLFQALFLMVYDLFLQRETFFKWNRAYLLISPIAAIGIPFIKFQTIQTAVSQEFLVQLPEVLIDPQGFIDQQVVMSAPVDLVPYIFYTGVLLFSCLFLFRLYKIIKMIRSNKVVKMNKYNLVWLENGSSDFSFLNYIFIQRGNSKNKEEEIIQHELVHCEQKHTLDLLVFEFFKIVMWFNPIIFLYQKRITLLHEYISDAEILKKMDKKSYFQTLLAETFNVEHISFINQFFNQSFIKKRIVMITKNKSNKIYQLKYLLIIPVLLSMLVFSSFEKKVEEGLSLENELDIYSADKYLNNTTLVKQDTIVPDNAIPFAIIDDVPVFPGCEGTKDQLRVCLQKGIIMHVNKNFNSNLKKELNLKPGVFRIYVMFEIDENGIVTNVKGRAKHQALVDEAIRVVKMLPKMKPGKHKGVEVGVKYSLPIAFRIEGESPSLDKKAKPHLINNKKGDADEGFPFAIIDNVPKYPGCEGTEEELRVCLTENITKFVNRNFDSKLAKSLDLKSGVQKIFVMFKINKNGIIADVSARASHDALKEEAIRVIKSLPKMVPGKQGNEYVSVKYSLPIAFNVD